jgi:uncharacterized protein (DUF2252 family)
MMTVEESHNLGRAARAAVPRSSHAEWQPSAGRPDPVSICEKQAATRVSELVPIRHERMLVSPFTFYRSAAAIMAADLAATPTSGIKVQCCGDAHLANFGGFESPERSMVFDINDFDETLPGPWEWDVKRLAASFTVAARDRGFDDLVAHASVRAMVRSYREAMRNFATMRTLDVWYSQLDVQSLVAGVRNDVSKSVVKQLQKATEKARSKNSLKAFAKLTEQVDGQIRIISDPPLVSPLHEVFTPEEAAAVREMLGVLFDEYTSTLQPDRRHLLDNYRLVDVARKVVGVGSVGTRCFIVLLLGRDESDPLFLQVKEAESSVLEPFVGKSSFSQHGQRVVEGQRLMQAASDIFLGWQRVPGVDGIARDYYVRQLWDGKISADLTAMPAQRLPVYGQVCGWTLARAHARSGDRIAIASYLGGGDVFDRALIDFAEAYADQNERDYEAVKAAVQAGHL